MNTMWVGYRLAKRVWTLPTVLRCITDGTNCAVCCVPRKNRDAALPICVRWTVSVRRVALASVHLMLLAAHCTGVLTVAVS